MKILLSKIVNLDGKLFNFYFYSRFKIKKNLKILENNFSYKFIVRYNLDEHNTLTKLATKYGSNKGGLKEIKVGNKTLAPHTYTDFYTQIFTLGREKVLNVFECGIGSNNPSLKSSMGHTGKPGASLYMWRDFFPNATVYGGDIDRDILFMEDRIKTHYLDQTNKQSIDLFFKWVGDIEFDLMIDDGLHTFEAGTTLYLNSEKYLSNLGVYIIEDVSQNDLTKYTNFFKELAIKVHVINLYRPNQLLADNNLILIRRRDLNTSIKFDNLA